MEFTPKKSKNNPNLRTNPYASGGQKHLSNFRNNRLTNYSLYATPRSYHKIKPATSKFKPRALNSTEQILRSTHSLSPQNEKFGLISCTDEVENDSDSPKNVRLEITGKDDASSLSDSDSEIYITSKHRNDSEADKENNIIFKPALQSYPGKKRPFSVRSKIAPDISPEKIERAYGEGSVSTFYSPNSNSRIVKFRKTDHKANEETSGNSNSYVFKSRSGIFKVKKVEDKENHSENVKSPTGEDFPHLIGFPNYGNTCYLNAVLQALVGLSCFTQDLVQAMKITKMSPTSISHSLWNVILNRQKCQVPDTRKALRVVKENFEKLDDSFTGFKMQDANEFLIRVLDAIKDEIDKINSHSVQNGEVSSSFAATPDKASSNGNLPNGENLDNNNLSIFDTPSQDSDISLELKPINGKPSLSIDDYEVSFKKDDDVIKNLVKSSQGLLASYLVTPAKSSSDESDMPDVCLPNFIKQNFEFELLESYRCHGCSNVVGRRQHHFALYVNLPKEGEESLQKAVESYASEDQRELTCEECSHKTSTVITSFTKLPRILIVQMKRYEYKADLLECIKVSSKVDVNLWLHLDSISSDNIESPPRWSHESVSSFSLKEKSSTLTVRNLSSELNICDKKDLAPCNIPETPALLSDDTLTSKEDKEMQEIMLRSIEDQGGVKQSDVEASRQKEEEEFQRAIQLSLQDMGMSYSFNGHDSETEVEAHENGSSEEQPGPHSYRLMSIISHFGLTTCTGHYVADVYNTKDGCWYHYDDESVSKIQENFVLADGRKQNGYIFFYVHNDIFQQLTSSNSVI